MIDKKHIEWYFNNLKNRNIISEGWSYYGFTETTDKVIIRYHHPIKMKNKETVKLSAYSFPKEQVLEELREAKLKQLFS